MARNGGGKQPPRESTVVLHIQQFLKTRGAWSVKAHGGSMQASGIPDILVCYRGRFMGLEAKAAKGNTTPLQEYEIETIQRAGGLAAVVRSAAEVEQMLDLIDAEVDGVSPAP